jgi:hypothetical protein
MRLMIRTEPLDVDSRLIELGLKREVLAEAVMEGMMARSECTPNDPPLFPGYSTFSRTVRSLREHLIPQPYGWSRCDDGGYSTVVSPDGKMAIAVATGDEHTGDPTITPLTKSPKGPRTQSAIEVNQYQQRYLFEEFETPELEDEQVNECVTWILLQRYDDARKEVSYELSLPISYAGKVDGWSERIILGTLPFDSSTVISVPILPNLPDIDVPLRRRA